EGGSAGGRAGDAPCRGNRAQAQADGGNRRLA
ncbi:MAG: Glucose-1-phosphate cytidylyltransferase, partial [uncultured Gemmatimonadetes bacterium]